MPTQVSFMHLQMQERNGIRLLIFLNMMQGPLFTPMKLFGVLPTVILLHFSLKVILT